jgi:hypothetical protein
MVWMSTIGSCIGKSPTVPLVTSVGIPRRTRLTSALVPATSMVDHVIDPLVAFHVAHPGFQALFSGSLVRAPRTSANRRTRCARVSVELGSCLSGPEGSH